MANLPTMASVARASTAADFDALYRDHAPRLRALAYHRLRDSSHAEDVVQETFLRAYRAIDRLDPTRPAWPWLRTIAENICTDVLRRTAVVSETPVGDHRHEPASPGDGDPNADAYLGAERRAGIKEALGHVHPRQRRILMLQAVEGWTPGAMAEAEGMSVTAVRAALKRGRKSFRRHYADLAAQRGLLSTGGLLAGLVARVRFEAARAQRHVARLSGLGVESVLPAGFVSVALAVGAAGGGGAPAERPPPAEATGAPVVTLAPSGAPEGAPEEPAPPAEAGTTGSGEDDPTTSWGKSIGAAPGPLEAQAGVEKEPDGRRKAYGVVIKDVPGREGKRTEVWYTTDCQGPVSEPLCDASDRLP